MRNDEGAERLRGLDYRRAVEAAGVIELPDDGEPAPTSHLPALLSGRFEDNDPPGAPR